MTVFVTLFAERFRDN